MKKYIICLFLFMGVSVTCLLVGYVVTSNQKQEEATGVPATELESSIVAEDRIVSNQKQVTQEVEVVSEEYYLVCEDSFLLVFLKDQKTICLYTHIPIMDFPEKEQERLRGGIWFGSMIEVFNYLESYTS